MVVGFAMVRLLIAGAKALREIHMNFGFYYRGWVSQWQSIAVPVFSQLSSSLMLRDEFDEPGLF